MDLSPSDLDKMIELAHAHSWVPLLGLVVWTLVRLMKSDRAVAWFPILVAPAYRSWIAVGLGILGGLAEKLACGGSWTEALTGGVVAGVAAISGHELVVESLRSGRDIGVKKPPPPPPMFPTSSPPPKLRPISIKPPATVPPPEPPAIGGDPPDTVRLAGVLVLAIVVAALGCSPKMPAEDIVILGVSAAECNRRGLAVVADGGGTCEEKRARLVRLVETDPACRGAWEDAGVVITCRARDAGTGDDHGD